MLVHLSNTSSYVCDLNRGSIEPANRMASAPTRKASALLEQKQTRTPFKLLSHDEVPMDTTTDINVSLQPVWYTEQTVVDIQQEDMASIIQEQQQRKSSLHRTTLSPIESDYVSITEEQDCPEQPSLMHKSSTFTIEPQPSINMNTQLNDSEKENVIKEDTTDHLTQPSDDSFRALEQLLGLGSTGTVRESPKTNHDTLSLTVVTPTDIINATTTSLRMSYALKGDSDSLPSSQDISILPTIESINSTVPPPFLVDNTTIEEEQSSTMNPQTSFDTTDNDTIKDDTNNDDETNFSFELNDFPDNSNNESTASVAPVPPPMITIRAPTCADVAYRALIKPRAGGRVSQPVKADSPLAKPNKIRSSAPTSRMLRSSCRRISTDSPTENSTNQDQSLPTECFVNDPQIELVEVVSLPEEEEEIEQEKTSSVTLNLTSPKEVNVSIQPENLLTPILSREYTFNTPKTRSSERRRPPLNNSRSTPIQQRTTIIEEQSNSPSIASKSMLGILLTNQFEGEPSVLQQTLTTSIAPSPVRTSTLNEEAVNSPTIASKSMLGILLTNQSEGEPSVLQQTLTNSIALSPVRNSTLNEEAVNSPTVASKSMLGILLTNPTEAERSVLQKPLTNSIVPSPVRTSIRQSQRLSSNPTPRASINPLHSSTPSASRHKSLQMVSIGEQEQVLTTVPQQIITEIQDQIEMIPINNIEESIQQPSTIEIGVQTTPSLDISSRRRLNRIEQPTTPIVQINKSSSIVIVNEQQQITPLQSKIVMNLQRNVRFQLTPTTDARLAVKEKQDETLCGLKPAIIINQIPIIPETKQENVKTIPIKKLTKPKKKVITSKKKKVASTKKIQPKRQPIEKKPRKEKPVKPIKSIKESKKITESVRSTKRKQPIIEVTPPTKRIPRKRTIPEVTIEPVSRKRIIPEVKIEPVAKRVPRKRTIPEVTIEPVAKRAPRKRTVPEVTNERVSRKQTVPEVTIEPVAKRVKTSKSVEVPLPSSNLPRTRGRSTNDKKEISEPIKRQSRTKIEPKSVTPTIKGTKRRLQSVEKNEGLKKKTEVENIQSIPPVQSFELNQEERQKIEALTVAGLKSRLNTHKEDIPKGAKKADLIALLIKIETNLLKERKEVETAPVITTRRRRNN